MEESKTELRERRITLAGKVYVVRELTMRAAATMQPLFQKLAHPETYDPTLASWFVRLWRRLTGQKLGAYGTMPQDMAQLFRAGGAADVTADTILDSTPTEITGAMGVLMSMNEFSTAPPKAETPPPPAKAGAVR